MKKIVGFTLIELAGVLTVISLIAGGIIAARSIIRTSQLQAVMGEYQMYAAAIKNFQNKYHALPGDFATATTLWGARVTCPVSVTPSSRTETCDGDGDGFIKAYLYEHIVAWRHLGISGFINGNYTGNTANGTISCSIDIKGNDNVPSSKLKGAGWNLNYSLIDIPYTTGGVEAQYIPMAAAADMPTIHALWLGGSLQDDDAHIEVDGTYVRCAHSQIPVLTGQEAYELDIKSDDGVSTSGRIRSQYNNTATYETCEDLASIKGAYRTNATGINCALAFILEP